MRAKMNGDPIFDQLGSLKVSPSRTDVRYFLALLLSLSQVVALADTLTGSVVQVTNGDTIVVLDDSNAQHKIRLKGIDTPEGGQAYGTKSKEHFSKRYY